jgi:hypothetical protein
VHRRLKFLIAVFVALYIAPSGIAWYKYQQIQRQESRPYDSIFYAAQPEFHGQLLSNPGTGSPLLAQW